MWSVYKETKQNRIKYVLLIFHLVVWIGALFFVIFFNWNVILISRSIDHMNITFTPPLDFWTLRRSHFLIYLENPCFRDVWCKIHVLVLVVYISCFIRCTHCSYEQTSIKMDEFTSHQMSPPNKHSKSLCASIKKNLQTPRRLPLTKFTTYHAPPSKRIYNLPCASIKKNSPTTRRLHLTSSQLTIRLHWTNSTNNLAPPLDL